MMWNYTDSIHYVGIGQGIALAYARNGIRNLVLTDLSTSHLSSTIAQLKAANTNINVLPLQANVASEQEVNSAFQKAAEAFGRIDVAVNVAGVGGAAQATTDIEESEWRRVVNINLDGVWRCQRAELKVMVGQESVSFSIRSRDLTCS
jgi:NAD(P)-dependent dehydrogenase (short-subunit alcohol dehydrogenase family)